MIGYVIGLIACWIFGDAVYSYSLYLNAPTYDSNARQTWKKDHWVRAVRAGLSVVLMVLGGMLI